MAHPVTTSGTSSENEWYKEWQRMTTSGTMNDNEWHNEWMRMTPKDNKWQWVRTNGNERYNEWNKWEQVKWCDFGFQNELKGQSGTWRTLFKFLCNIYSYYIFSNTDNLKIGKLMTYTFNIIFSLSLSCKYFFIFFEINFVEVVNQVKLILNVNFFLKI